MLLELQEIVRFHARGEQGKRVLDGVSLTLEGGEIAAIVSSRFGGRTTLLKVAAGLIAPDAGAVRFNGNDVADLNDRSRSRLLAGMISWSGPTLHLRDEHVIDSISLPLLVGSGRSQRQAKRMSLVALAKLGLESCAQRRWTELSSQERTLCALARATIRDPALIVLDDLFDGLGLIAMQEALDALRAMVAESGCAVLMSSCDLEAAASADSVYWLESGSLSSMAGGRSAGADVIELHAKRPAQRPSSIGG